MEPSGQPLRDSCWTLSWLPTTVNCRLQPPAWSQTNKPLRNAVMDWATTSLVKNLALQFCLNSSLLVIRITFCTWEFLMFALRIGLFELAQVPWHVVMRKGKKLGQAPALSAGLWGQWLNFLGQTCGARLKVIVAFTGYFGLRTGEAVALKKEDIHIDGDIPKICVKGEVPGSKKSPGDVYIRKRHLAWVRKLMKHGITTERTKKHKHGKGKEKKITFQDKYTVPEKGWMFPARAKATAGHVCYHAVYAQIKRAAPLFLKHLKQQGKKHSPDVGKLRPHSGHVVVVQCFSLVHAWWRWVVMMMMMKIMFWNQYVK